MTATGLEPTTSYFINEHSNHLAKLAKYWVNVSLRTKWLWVWVQSQSLDYLMDGESGKDEPEDIVNENIDTDISKEERESYDK